VLVPSDTAEPDVEYRWRVLGIWAKVTPVTLHLHEISESEHRVLNPFTEEQLRLLGTVCRIGPDTRILDLACGKAEMLAQWATERGSSGVGVDLSAVFLAAGRDRLAELGVSGQVELVESDAGDYRPEPHAFDIGSCIGATWIGNGVTGTVDMLRPAVRPDGLFLIGEVYWRAEPSADACAAIGIARDEAGTLVELLDEFEAARLDLVEMVLADTASWDRHVAAQWWNQRRWLDSHPGHEWAADVRACLDRWRRTYLTFRRQLLGWGVFVLRPMDTPS
jgi:SAM-dependent methyltransferase